jgi:uncharacterized protein (DUF433 family)
MTAIAAFGVEHVCRLTGLSARQLAAWERTGVFLPEYPVDGRPASYRVYSSSDVVVLSALAVLRTAHRLPQRELRRVGAWLAEHRDRPWADLGFSISGRAVRLPDPRSEPGRPSRIDGSTVVRFEMQPIAQSVQDAIDRLVERRVDAIGRVVQDRAVLDNTPVLAETRIPAAAIWDLHQAGYDTTSIIREYPSLSSHDVAAAIAYEEQRRRKRAS